MSILARNSFVTPEEFEALSDTRGIELIDGSLKEKSMGTESGSTNARIMIAGFRVRITDLFPNPAESISDETSSATQAPTN